MEKRTATCRCGQLQVTCEGEPVRVSVCHCLDCQRRERKRLCSAGAMAGGASYAHWPIKGVGACG